MASKLQEQYDAILEAMSLVNKELARTANKNTGIDYELRSILVSLLDASETIKSLMKLVELAKG
jgi:archaellum component FlaC